jgi:prepilin-type N-terminal cleavage/methylation domain-containing protein
MKQKRGLTLIELLITMVLIGIVLIIITSIYVTGFRTYREELTSSIVQSNAQTILDALVLDVKNGMLVEQTYDTYSTGPDSIIIRVPALNSDHEIQYDGSDMLFDRVIYYYQNNEIHKVTFADPSSIRYPKNGIDTVLDKNILSLGFEYDPDQTTATLVKATISSNIKVSNRNKQITISGQARLRNHI